MIITGLDKVIRYRRECADPNRKILRYRADDCHRQNVARRVTVSRWRRALQRLQALPPVSIGFLRKLENVAKLARRIVDRCLSTIIRVVNNTILRDDRPNTLMLQSDIG